MREKVLIRTMLQRDVPALLLNLRLEDIQEIVASGWDPLQALHECVAQSTNVWSAIYRGELLACFGIIPHPETTKEKPITVVWMLSTAAVSKYPRAFYRASKDVVEQLGRMCGNLTNYVHAPYERSRRWAKHLGFHEKGVTTGPRGDMFVCIVRPGVGFEMTPEVV